MAVTTFELATSGGGGRYKVRLVRARPRDAVSQKPNEAHRWRLDEAASVKPAEPQLLISYCSPTGLVSMLAEALILWANEG